MIVETVMRRGKEVRPVTVRKMLNPTTTRKKTFKLLLFFLSGGIKVRDVDEDNSLLSMTPSQDSIPPPDPIRVEWPKVINKF